MSGIPKDICGMCYHPKTEAATCNRRDCELSPASPCSPLDPQGAASFAAWMVDNVEGDEVTEESLIRWLARFLKEND